jgi:hypothetical protein
MEATRSSEVGYYKIHTTPHPERQHSYGIVTAIKTSNPTKMLNFSETESTSVFSKLWGTNLMGLWKETIFTTDKLASF